MFPCSLSPESWILSLFVIRDSSPTTRDRRSIVIVVARLDYQHLLSLLPFSQRQFVMPGKGCAGPACPACPDTPFPVCRQTRLNKRDRCSRHVCLPIVCLMAKVDLRMKRLWKARHTLLSEHEKQKSLHQITHTETDKYRGVGADMSAFPASSPPDPMADSRYQ